MKIYTEDDTETDSVELLLNYRELREMANALAKFEEKVREFKMENKDNLGFTHLHFKDCGLTGKDSKADVVFYVDLSDA